jgi:hypothetical protein
MLPLHTYSVLAVSGLLIPDSIQTLTLSSSLPQPPKPLSMSAISKKLVPFGEVSATERSPTQEWVMLKQTFVKGHAPRSLGPLTVTSNVPWKVALSNIGTGQLPVEIQSQGWAKSGVAVKKSSSIPTNRTILVIAYYFSGL